MQAAVDLCRESRAEANEGLSSRAECPSVEVAVHPRRVESPSSIEVVQG